MSEKPKGKVTGVVHIAGFPVKVGSRGRQFCAWCGHAWSEGRRKKHLMEKRIVAAARACVADWEERGRSTGSMLTDELVLRTEVRAFEKNEARLLKRNGKTAHSRRR